MMKTPLLDERGVVAGAALTHSTSVFSVELGDLSLVFSFVLGRVDKRHHSLTGQFRSRVGSFRRKSLLKPRRVMQF